MNSVYLALLIKWYNPRGYTIRRYKMVNRIARRMLQNGYNALAVKMIANEARAYYNLSPV